MDNILSICDESFIPLNANNPKEEKKQPRRNKVTPPPPETQNTSTKSKGLVIHLGSDIEEEDIIPIKPKERSKTTTKGKHKMDSSGSDRSRYWT